MNERWGGVGWGRMEGEGEGEGAGAQMNERSWRVHVRGAVKCGPISRHACVDEPPHELTHRRSGSSLSFQGLSG